MNILPAENYGKVDQDSPAKFYPVCPFARAVPNGIDLIERNGKKRFLLKATVMLTPEPLGGKIDGAGAAFSLSHWPEDVLKAILDDSDEYPALTIPLMLQLAPRDPPADKYKPLTVNAKVVWSTDRAREIQKRVTEFRDLWERTFLQRGLTWSDLRDALSFSMGGKGYTAGNELKPTQDGSDPGDPKPENLPQVGSAGEIQIETSLNQIRTISGIYTQGHADMALALEYGRVNRIAQHLKSGRDDRTSDQATGNAEEETTPPFSSNEEKEQKLAKAHIERRKAQFERLHINHAIGRAAYRAEQGEQKAGLAGHCSKLEDEDAKRPPPVSVILEADTCQECLKTGKDAHGYLTPSMKRKDQSQSGLRDDQQKRAAQIYFAVQSTGALSRLYCLAFDVEYELTDTDLTELSSWSLDGDVLFVCVSARDESGLTFGSKSNCRPPWSITKLTFKDSEIGGSSGDFWPVTREEVRAVRDGMSKNLSRFTSQLDGYRVTGECWQKNDKQHSPRFDLTSLDVRSATEQELSGEANERPAFPGEVVTTAFHTAGLAVLDRGMQAEKARKLARKDCCDFSSEEQLLYADDLTIGFRMDVGVPEGDKTRWRPLHLRKVDYGTSGPMGYVADSLLPLFAGSFRDPARLAFDAAMVAMPEQLVPKKDPSDVDLAVAENTVTWEGAPLGVEPLQPLLEYERGSKNAKKISRPLDGLPFGKDISLPSKGNHLDGDIPRPPRLRFGWPYRFAMRAVYSGGTSVSPGSVDWITDSYDGRLTFPGISTDGGAEYKPSFFRFLRQKPIDPPVLLQPLAEALNKNDGAADPGKVKAVMGYQEATRVIVRSLKNELPGRGRAQPTIAYRTILPPAMAMDDVARHGALDEQFGEAVPAGAFSSVKWDKTRNSSGFPVLQIDSVQGFDGTWLANKTRTKADLRTPQIARDIALQASANKNQRRRTSFTSPVFCKCSESEKGRQQYYPDPFAQRLILNLRHSGTNLPFGETIEVPIYKGASASSTRPKPADALPVVLKFIAGVAKPEKAGADNEAAYLWKKRYIKLTADGLPVSSTTEALAEAIEVSIFISAGLKLDIDCFFLPDPKTLATKSALVQALAVSAGLRGQTVPGANPAITNDEVIGGFRKLLGEDFSTSLRKKIAETKEAPRVRQYLLSSPGGLPAPDEIVLQSVAEVLTERMIRVPVPDVSGVTRLSCEHASDAISNIEERIKLTSPIFHRVEKNKFDDKLKEWFKHPSNQGAKMLNESLVVENETDTLLQGMLEIDLLRISGFDLVAEMENPGNGVFDDKTRKRDLASVRAGTWPVIRDVEGDAYIKNSRQIFGFDLLSNGKVELPKAEVVLFKVRDLPPQLIGEFEGSENGNTLIELLHLVHRLQPLAKGKKHHDNRYGDAKVEAVHSFSDCVGRNVRLKITPVLRSLPSLRTADQLIAGEHILGDPFAANQKAYPLDQPVYLPSSVRPAAPAVRGPLQCFNWLTSSSVKPNGYGSKLSVVPPPLVEQMDLLPLHHWAIRQPVIRLNLARSWFSSDANEKVALVFWPPDPECQPWLQVNKPKLLNKIRYRRNPTEEGCDAGKEDLLRDIVLSDFQDEDLGPGGRFTTRLGADPLKIETPDPRIFLHYSDFLPVEAGSPFDGKAETADALPKPKLVQNALMPVSAVEDTEGEKDPVSEGRTVSRFMSVSLLVYEPRFDPESENWYIDVNLNKMVRHVEPFIRFGLVRYNDNPSVAKTLRISPPSAVWAKHLPERTVQTKYDPSAGVLFVQVDGQALGTGLQARGVDNSQQDMPRLHAKVIREKYRNLSRDTGSKAGEPKANEVTIRQTVSLTRVPLKIEPQRTGTPRKVKADRGDDGWIDLNLAPVGPPHACWVGAVELDLKSDLKASERLVLLVEEVELYRPATYPNEPVNPAVFLEKEDNGANSGDYLVETGPRFSCRIEFYDKASLEDGGAK